MPQRLLAAGVNPYTNTGAHTSGWMVSSGSVNMSFSSEGMRIWKAAGTDSAQIQSPWFNPPANFKAVLSGVRFRRNTAASQGGFGWYIRNLDMFEGTTNYLQYLGVGTTSTTGTWVRMARSTAVNVLESNDDNADQACLVIALNPGAVDITIDDLDLYHASDSDIPASAAVDSSDAGVTWTIPDDSLTVTGQYDGLNNEQVEKLVVDWGDFSALTTSNFALPDYQQSPVATPPRWTHAYAKAGIYDVTVKASNPVNSYTRTYTFAVPSGDMEAKFTSVVDYPNVTVNASSSIAPTRAPVQRYVWNWGDGTTATGVQQTKTYATAGTYNITLTIYNDSVNRSSTLTRPVVVKAPDRTAVNSNFAIGLVLDDPQDILTPGAAGVQAQAKEILDWDSFSWNWTRNEASTAKFNVPSDWLKKTVGTDLAGLKSDLVLRFNYGAGWVEGPNGRMIVTEEKADPLNPQTRVSVTAKLAGTADLEGLLFTPSIIGTAYTKPEIAAGYARLLSGVNAGQAMRRLIPVQQAPGTGGALLKFTSLDFGDAVDSGGATWATTISNLEVPPAANGMSLVNTLVDNGACDWYFQANVLRAFNQGSSGKRASGTAIPELVAGRDITAAPQVRSPKSRTYGAIVVSSKLAPVTAVDSDSTSPSYRQAHYRGQRYVPLQADNADTADAALAMAKPTLAALNRAIDGEMTRELRFYDDMPWMPIRDYWVGDFVYAPGPDGKPALMAIEGLTLMQDSTNGLSASITLGSAFAVNALQKKVASMSGGQGISVGAAGERPPSALSGFIQTLVSAKVTNDNGSFDAGSSLILEGKNTNGATQIELNANSAGPFIRAQAIYDRLAGTANVSVSSTGVLSRITSATKYKLAIDSPDFGESVLGLQPRTWYERDATEAWADALHRGAADSPEATDIPPLIRYPGLLAEDVEAAGLTEFVQYGPDGDLEGIAYERLWVPLIPIIRRQRDTISEQDQRIDRLERALERVLARLDPDSNGDLND